MNSETGSRTASGPSSERDEKPDAVTTGAEEHAVTMGAEEPEEEFEEAGSMNRDPITGTPGSHPLGTAVGTASGVIAGACAGAIAGPVGVAVGGVIGAIVGAAAGHGSGEELNPTADEALIPDEAVDPGARLDDGA